MCQVGHPTIKSNSEKSYSAPIHHSARILSQQCHQVYRIPDNATAHQTLPHHATCRPKHALVHKYITISPYHHPYTTHIVIAVWPNCNKGISGTSSFIWGGGDEDSNGAETCQLSFQSWGLRHLTVLGLRRVKHRTLAATGAGEQGVPQSRGQGFKELLARRLTVAVHDVVREDGARAGM